MASTVLSALALAGFVLAGVARFIGIGAWRPLAIAAACASLVTIALFWDVRMVFGVAVDAGILIALLWAQWPEQATLGLDQREAAMNDSFESRLRAHARGGVGSRTATLANGRIADRDLGELHPPEGS